VQNSRAFRSFVHGLSPYQSAKKAIRLQALFAVQNSRAFRSFVHGLSPYQSAKKAIRLQAVDCFFCTLALLIAFLDIISFFVL